MVLGDPVEHSLSPVIQTAALRRAGIDGVYTARRVDAAGMRDAVSQLRRRELAGANVTMPHKRLAWELCDRYAGAAERARAVNTLAIDDDSLLGANTDVDGVRFAWERAALSSEAPVVVLGAGGAAAAALLALESSRRPLMVSARRADRATRLLSELAMDDVEVVAWGDMDALPDGVVVVNATPLGMRGERLPVGLIDVASGLFEMAYGTGDSPALRDAAERGLAIAQPLDMLIGQAAASFRIWLEKEADVDAMYAAVRGFTAV